MTSPRPFPLLVALTALSSSVPAQAQLVVVEPYLQNATPSQIWVMWETSSGDESVVEWGETTALGQNASGVADAVFGASRLHEVQLEGLSPATRYYYKVRTEGYESGIYDLVTPPDPADEASFKLVAMSDMQRDAGNPDVFEEVIHDGIIDFVSTEFSADLPAELAFALVPGDLVDYGPDYVAWLDTYFAPSADLSAHVPFYPVYGNHEADTAYFTQYFHLPDNATPGYEEHWYSFDYSNLRVIGLDSNSGYRIQEQLDWLDDQLAEACADATLDFVFAQLHHPHLSELWLPGEIDYTGEVIARMEAFTTDCGKPSIHFFGHTHGYSRGQSRDHRHLWVNVATAGGNIDYWGEYAQQDYEEFTVSQDEWGFVLVEVDAGADPQLRLRRISRGNENLARDNDVRDEVLIRGNGQAPITPECLEPAPTDVSPDCFTLVGSEFVDPDGDLHGASHWQLASSCDGFDDPLIDRWLQHENWYYDVDTRAGDDLWDEEVAGLEEQTSYCWRVRYRDRGLEWSDWSEPSEFTTGLSALTDNLIVNPGAEDGTDGWTVNEGYLESLTDGECDAISPHTGDRFFCVGGACDSADYGEAVQRIDLTAYAAEIDAEQVIAYFSGLLSTWGGDDHPEMQLVFWQDDNTVIDFSETLDTQAASWTALETLAPIPPGTRFVDVMLKGTRNAGNDNDSYFDDLSLVLSLDGEIDCDNPPMGDDDDDDSAGDDDDDDGAGDDDDAAGDDDDDGEGDDEDGGGCGSCSTADRRPPWGSLLLLLAAIGAVRRRR